MGDKRVQEYKRRIAALPAEYRQVFQKLKNMHSISNHSGANMFNALTDLLDLFEEGLLTEHLSKILREKK